VCHLWFARYRVTTPGAPPDGVGHFRERNGAVVGMSRSLTACARDRSAGRRRAVGAVVVGVLVVTMLSVSPASASSAAGPEGVSETAAPATEPDVVATEPTPAGSTAPAEPSAPHAKAMSVAPCSGHAPDEAAAATVAQECGRDVEVVSKRTEFNTVYAQADGNMRLEISMAAVRTDVDGEWAGIDNTIVDGEGVGLEVASPAAEMVFSDGTDGEPLVRMVRDGQEVELDVPFDLTEPEVLGSSVMYPEVLPGVDLLVTVNEDATGVSEVLRVDSPEAAANPALAELAFPVEVSDGLDVEAVDGGFDVTDSSGEAVFTSPMPAMWDSSAERTVSAPSARPRATGVLAALRARVTAAAEALGRASTRLQSPVDGDDIAAMPVEVGDDEITLSPDAGLLTGEETVWPVYIDPSLGMNLPTERKAVRWGYSDYYNFPDDQGVGYCNKADPYGYTCPATFTSQLLYEFDGLDLIGSMNSSEIIGAEFSAYGTHSYSCTPTNVQAWRIAPFSSATTWSGVTWTRLLQTHTIAHRPSCGNARWVGFDVTVAVGELANENGSILAFGLRAADQMSMTGWKRYRYDARLAIVYNRAPSTPTNLRVVTGAAVQSCPNGGTAYIGAGTTNLWADLADPDVGSRLRGNFDIFRVPSPLDATTAIFSPAWTGSQASGMGHSVTVPAQRDANGNPQPGAPPMVHNGSYTWRVESTDDDPNRALWSPRAICTLIADFVPPTVEPTVTAVAGGGAVYASGGVANGGVGVPGNFAFAYPQADDIAGYRYSLNGDTSELWVAGASPTLAITPRGYGPQTLWVHAIDKAGNASPGRLYDFVVTRTGPGAEWRFDQSSGTAVPDSSDSPGDYSMSVYGTPTWVTGTTASLGKPYAYGSDRALQFDASGDDRVAFTGPVTRTDESFTVSAMVRLDSIPGGSSTAVSQDGTNTAGFSLGYRAGAYCTGGGSGCWSFFMYNNDDPGYAPVSVQSSDVPVVAGQWVQLAGSYDAEADQMRLMVCTVPTSDTATVTTSDDATAFTSTWNASGKFRVGQAAQGTAHVRPFIGDISGIRVYNGVADDADFSRACTKGYWDMPLDASGDEATQVAANPSADAAQVPVDPADPMTPAVPEVASWPAAATGQVTVATDPDAALTEADPIGLATETEPAQGEQATVELLNHAAAVAAGVDGLLFEVTPTAPAPGGTDPLSTAMTNGEVEVVVDYSGFAGAYGADWASRLVVVQLEGPDCDLAAPDPAKCTQTPVVSTNLPATSQLVATVPSSASVLGVTAAASGSAGDWSATSLSPSAAWQVSAQTGDFSWSYPMRVPAAVGGPEPELSLSYSSGSVDGRVASANGQSSWVGDGWDLTTGYVERQYVSCAEDNDASTANNYGHDTSDLCWRTDNATLVFNGQSQELVRVPGTDNWRLKNDDGTRVQRLTGAANGDNDGEYWVVTTTDGTRYTFGREQRGADVGSTDPTKNLRSAWTVPVYANNSGEAGFASSNFAGSVLPQAWRWNMDYVVDTSGNSMTYWYTEEGNSYTENYSRNSRGAVAQYVRGGYLSRIDYGQRAGSETGSTTTATAPMWVGFAVAERCVAGACGTGEITQAAAPNWPDVPADLICTSATSCPMVGSPAFFSRKRLTAVSTHVAGRGVVDTWNLGQTYPDPGDGTSASLWLSSVQHVGGSGGTSVTLPNVTFSGEQRANRVDNGLDEGPPMNRYRLNRIASESGGVTTIAYKTDACPVEPAEASAPNNQQLCIPVYWTPEGAQNHVFEYFYKYVVDSVVENPRDGVSQPTEAHYVYEGSPAWRYDNNPLAAEGDRTWNEFAGYASVRVINGANSASVRSMVQYRYFRGMNGDHLPGGGTRSVQVDGIPDDERLAGFLRESITYNGVNGPVVSRTVNEPWTATTATGADGTKATLLQVRSSETHLVASQLAGGERVTRTVNTYDPVSGLPTMVEDLGDVATAADDRCTRAEYVQNASANILTTVKRSWTVGVACSVTAPATSEVISDVLTWYDGGAYGAAPTRGLVTTTQRVASFNGSQPVYVTEATMTYDANGRVRTVADALGRTTTTAYTPASGGPVTGTTTTSPDPDGGGALTAHVTSAVVDPAWGVPTRVTDANNKVTTASYDGLGRLVSVWLPGRPQATMSPTTTYAYTVDPVTGMSAVTTKALSTDGSSYRTSVALYDGLLRPRQTQSESAARATPGRVVTDTMYDTRGLVVETNGEWFTTGAPSTTVVNPGLTTVVPSSTSFVYDGLGRAVTETFEVNGQPQWHTTTTYDGDRVSVDPPTGATAQTTVSDARGQTIQLWQYLGDQPTGDHQVTAYSYDDAGRLVGMRDPAGNAWSYAFDVRGRQVSATDPDKGTSTTTYDNAGQVTSATDARGQRLAFVYDNLGRKVELREGSTTGTVRARWVYDTLAKGQATSSTRYVGGAAYVTSVTGFDDGYRPLGQSVTIPASETGLAGTYTTGYTYTANGAQATTSLPAVGNLPAETVTTVYDEVGAPRWLMGAGTYVADSLYSGFGEPLQYDLGNTYAATVSHSYQEGSRRLGRAWLWAEGTDGYAMDVAYTYDAAGNPTSAVDTAAGQPVNTACYTFDGLRRLTSAWTPGNGDCTTPVGSAVLGGPAPYGFTDTFDQVGNRTRRVAYAPTGAATTSTYTYDTNPAPGTPGPHALVGVSVSGPAGTSAGAYAYDTAGNTVTRDPADAGAQTLSWDVEGELAAVDGVGNADASYVYTADGDRLVRREGGATTVYLPGGQEITRNNTTGAVTGTRYYAFNGQVIAVRTQAGYAGVDSLVSDPQGTAQVAVDNATNQVTRRYFDPYGNPVGGSGTDWAGDHGFLNKPVDDTGLVAIGARYYDPGIARFISVDPVMDLTDPGQWQGYAYANNNPVTYTDPTGLKAMKRFQKAAKAPVKMVKATEDPPPDLNSRFRHLAETGNQGGFLDLYNSMDPEDIQEQAGLAGWQEIQAEAIIYNAQADICWAPENCMEPATSKAGQWDRASPIVYAVGGELLGLGFTATLGNRISSAWKAWRAGRAATSGFGTLSRAGEFGVRSYRALKANLRGTGLEAHHLVEQRFAGVMGQSAGDMASVAVTQAEHQVFTNAWRQAIPYGEGTLNATPAQIEGAARQIYADYPDILSALGLG
jgi:RHS repeat-associated protein